MGGHAVTAPALPAACRVATPQDTPALVALWRAVFGDEEGFIRLCLERFAGPGQVFVADTMDRPVTAMLLAVPCGLRLPPEQGKAAGDDDSAGEMAGAYLYALATALSHQKQGLMSALMAYAEGELARRGCRFAVLVPAEASLFGFYRQRGYKTTLALRHATRRDFPWLDGGKTGEKALDGFKMVSAGQNARRATRLLREQRAAFLPVPHVGFDEGRTALVLADAGASVCATDQGYAVCRFFNGRLMIDELGAAHEAAARDILAALANVVGDVERLEFSLPVGSGLFAEQGAIKPYAAAKVLCPGVQLPQALYFRFGMDAE